MASVSLPRANIARTLSFESTKPRPEKVSELTPECTAATQKSRTSALVAMHKCPPFSHLLCRPSPGKTLAFNSSSHHSRVEPAPPPAKARVGIQRASCWSDWFRHEAYEEHEAKRGNPTILRITLLLRSVAPCPSPRVTLRFLGALRERCGESFVVSSSSGSLAFSGCETRSEARVLTEARWH